MIEAEFLGYMTSEERIKTNYYNVLRQDAWASFTNCVMLLPSMLTWEFANTFWDIIALVDYFVEDCIFAPSGWTGIAAYEMATLDEQDQSDACIIGTWTYYSDYECDDIYDYVYPDRLHFYNDGLMNLDALCGQWTITGNTLIVTFPVDPRLRWEGTVSKDCNQIEGNVYYDEEMRDCWLIE
jgi:hypothetical protein